MSAFTELLLSLLITATGVGTPAATMPADCPNSREPVTNIGERKISTAKFQAGSVERQKEIFENGARYLRARIEIDNPGSCDWLLTVRDADYHVIQTFDRTDFQGTRNRWTNRVPSVSRGANAPAASRIIFTLSGCPGTTPEIRFPEYIMMAEKTRNPYYSLQIPNRESYKPLYKLSDAENATGNKPLGDNVGFMMGSWLKTSWTCSGVLLTENLFLTNWHCGGPREIVTDGTTVVFPESGYWSEFIIKDTIVDISFDDDGLSMEYIGKRLVAMDPDLDFALIEVVPIDAARRGLHVPINTGPLANGQDIKIVHHPEALQKRITLGCRVDSNAFDSWRNNVAGVDFTHRCDTEGGSSGAPVFNLQNQLVGLHHRGFRIDPATCTQKDRVNKAVHISKIYQYLQSCHPDVAAQLLLTTTPGPAGPCPAASPTPPSQ